jgi:hypothetical protein
MSPEELHSCLKRDCGVVVPQTLQGLDIDISTPTADLEVPRAGGGDIR